MSSQGNGPQGRESGDFIPFGESTPRSCYGGGGGGGWRGSGSRGNQRPTPHRWGNNSRYHSNTSRQSENEGISAYLHPSMLQDPWQHLTRRAASSRTPAASQRAPT